MDLCQVIREGDCAIVVQVGGAAILDPIQIEEVLLPLDLLHEQEVLDGISCADQLPFFCEVAHIHRWDVFGEGGECRILPDHYPRPV